MPSSMPNTTFPSKIDGWLLALLLGATLVGVCAVAFIGARAGNRVQGWLALALLLPATLLPPWLLLRTRYRFLDHRLLVESGPFRWHVNLADVRSVTPTRSPLSSPALSLDRLRIEHGQAGALMVSPQDKDGFLRMLQTQCAGLQCAQATNTS